MTSSKECRVDCVDEYKKFCLADNEGSYGYCCDSSENAGTCSSTSNLCSKRDSSNMTRTAKYYYCPNENSICGDSRII